ncbi:MAG: prolyl aminopeptidase [Burkholderiales bacterium]
MSLPSGNTEFLYPLVASFAETPLSVGDGHLIYVEQSGRADGFPALFLHGGPGSHTRAQHRGYFDPDFYRIVLFDQRGCGKSTPLGYLGQNSTPHLVSDIEHLRAELGVERWLLFGGSWGSTLALAYATTYPEHVAGMVLRGVFLATASELDWYLYGLRCFVPEAWEKLAQGASANLLARYHAEVNHPERKVALAAARRWTAYEESVMSIGTKSQPTNESTDENALLARSRVQLHYLTSGCFLREGELLERAWRVGAPTIIVQGRMDMVCPPCAAFALARVLPSATLRIVESAGHSASEPSLAQALRRATDEMRTILHNQR